MEFKHKFDSLVLRALRPVKEQPLCMLFFFLMLVHPIIGWIFAITSIELSRRLLTGFQGLLMLTGLSWMATCLVYRLRWTKWVLYILFWLLLAVSVFVGFNFKMSISQQTMTIMMETNPKESSEFFDTYAFKDLSLWSYAVDLASLLIIVTCESMRPRLRRVLGRAFRSPWWGRVVATLGMVGSVWLAGCYIWLATCGTSASLNKWRRIFPHDSIDLVTQTMHGLNSLRCSANDLVLALAASRQVYDTPASVVSEDSLTVGYILGESYNKHHASTYGYDLPTTPNMERERDNGNLYVFNNAVCHENFTSLMEKSTFSLNSIGDGESWFEFPSFLTVFKHSGYDVWMWDMQREFMTKRLYTITVNDYLYSQEMTKLSYTECNKRRYGYDGGLVDNFLAKKLPGRHNLVMLHIMGQHVAYFQRYPKQCAAFNYTDIKRKDKYLDKSRKTTIAQYDNATRYNDAVMKQLFDHYRDKNAVIVYLTDHGEEIYDYRDHCGRNVSRSPKPDELRYQNEAFFVVWCSDVYKARHPELVKNIEASLDRPFMTDVVGHMMLSLGQVETPYYNPAHDVISPSYKPSKRNVYGRADYDEVMATGK